jgi:hypothetical protein
MFDKQYYEEKGKKLSQKLDSKRVGVIQAMVNLLNVYIGEEGEIIQELKEVHKAINENTTNNENKEGTKEETTTEVTKQDSKDGGE